MMAKQTDVHTGFCLDTCEDKHWFTWLTLTPCWINTHLLSELHSHIQQLLWHSDAFRHHGCIQPSGWRPQSQQTASVQGSELHGYSPPTRMASEHNSTYLYYGLTVSDCQHSSLSWPTGNKTEGYRSHKIFHHFLFLICHYLIPLSSKKVRKTISVP